MFMSVIFSERNFPNSVGNLANSAIHICCRLLRILMDWLMKLRCRHYFMINCNLLNFRINIDNYDYVLEKLSTHIDANILTKWFLEEYLLVAYDFKKTYCKNTFSYKEYACLYPEVGDMNHKFILLAGYIHRMVFKPNVYILKLGDVPLLDYHNSIKYVKHIGMVDVAFVEYFKAFVMLQVNTMLTIHGKHDTCLALLCSLFVNQSNFTEKLLHLRHSSCMQLIDSKHYFEVAKLVITGQFKCDRADRYLTIKLAKILTAKELALTNVYPDDSCKCRLRLYLAAMYLVTKRHDKCYEYLVLASTGVRFFNLADTDSWIDGRYLSFMDDVAVISGLLNLISDKIWSSVFLISTQFLIWWLHCLCRMEQDPNQSSCIFYSCHPRTPFETMLFASRTRRRLKYLQRMYFTIWRAYTCDPRIHPQ